MRVIELAKDIFDLDLEDSFLEIIRKAPSNIPEFRNGEYIFEKMAVPARMDFLKLSAHLAVSILFKEKIKNSPFYCFNIEWKNFEKFHSGKSQLICAHVVVTSRITGESQEIEFVLIHLGDHNINVGALPYSGDDAYRDMLKDFSGAFKQGYIANALRILDKYFEGNLYSLNDLFRDQRKEIIDIVFSQTLDGVEDQLKNIYQQYYSVMHFFSDIHLSLPPVFSHIARFVQSRDIELQLNQDDLNVEEITRHIDEAGQYGVELDSARIEEEYLKALHLMFHKFSLKHDEDALRQYEALLQLGARFPFNIDLSDVQGEFSIMALNPKRDFQIEFPNTYHLIEKAAGHLNVRLKEVLSV